MSAAVPPERNLYVDVEGVLVGRQPDGGRGLAQHLDTFLAFAERHFRCHWLSTHCCYGDPGPLLAYLERMATPGQMESFGRFRPTSFRALKTEALRGDFYWLDDAPVAAERRWLAARGQIDRLIVVDTASRGEDLLHAIETLRARANLPKS